MSDLKPCFYDNARCLCQDCKFNAVFDDCKKGFCINCFECEEKGKPVHDVYICTGHERRTE